MAFGAFYFLVMAKKGRADQLLQILSMNKAMNSAYTGLLELVAQVNLSITDNDLFANTKQSLPTIEAGRLVLPYSATFISFINQVFYSSSCDIVRNWLPTLNCTNYLEGNTIQSPFTEGLSFYFSSLSFYLYERIEEVEKATGLLSTPFYLLFKKISVDSFSEWKLFTGDTFTYDIIWLAANIVICSTFILIVYLAIRLHFQAI